MTQMTTSGQFRMDGEDLVWVDGNTRHRVGELVRCFPATSPDRWVSIRSEDGTELALIRELNELDLESASTVEPLLVDKYHVPKVVRIESIENSDTGKRLCIDTHDGSDEIDVNDVDFSQYPKVILRYRGKGRKYEITNTGELDKKSLGLIRQHLRMPGLRGGRNRNRIR